MKAKRFLLVTLSLLMLTLSAHIGGCDKSSDSNANQKATTPPPADATQVAAAGDWCAEHGVPESICTRCNSKLIPEFRKKGDWCTEHGLPESQCLLCNPELKEKFEAMKPK